MIEYIVNKEKRTVVAIIKFNEHEQTFKGSNYIYEDIGWLFTRLGKNKFNQTEKFYQNCNKMFFPKIMSAKAKCSLDDKWDEEYGKQLARQRLVEKIRKYRSNSYKIISDLIEEMREAISIKK